MKLSIALTTYNGAKYLGEQLDSFKAQTRQPDELVVCDEQSSDATAQILSDFQGASPFPVRVVINESRLGIIANFEKAIGLCSGDVIFLSDQDDFWHPDKLARHQAIYEANPDVGLVFSDATVVDGDRKPLGMRMNEHLGITPDRLAQLNGPRALHLLVRRPFLLGCTISFRASLRRFLNPFPANQLHDNWIPFALSTVTRFQGVAEPLIDYRRHNQQVVGVNTLRDDLPAKPDRTRAEEFAHQANLLDTLERHVAGFRDQVKVDDFDRVIAGKRAYLGRRKRNLAAPVPLRVLGVARDLISGSYFRHAGYPKSEFLNDLRGR